MALEQIDSAFTIQASVLFLVTFALTVGFMSFDFGSQPEKFREPVNISLDSENNVQEVKIDNETVDFMFEDQDAIRVYVDKDQDGSSDLELNLTHDGNLHRDQQILTFDKTSYTVYYEYRDNSSIRGDELFKIYLIEEF